MSAFLFVLWLAVVLCSPIVMQKAAFGRIPAQTGGDDRAALREKFRRIGDLFNEGEAAMAKRDYAHAEKALTAAVALARESGDDVSIGVMLDALGGVYSARGDMDQAIQLQTQAVGILRSGDDKASFGRSLINLAVTYNLAGQTEKSIKTIQECIAVWHQQNNGLAEAAALAALGDYQKDAGRLDAAIASLRQSLEMRESMNAGAKALAACHNDIGRVLAAQAKFGEARHEYEVGLGAAQHVDDTELTANLLCNLGAAEADQGDFADAMDVDQKALALREKGNDPEVTAQSLGCLSAVCFDSGHYDQALFYTRRALSLTESTGSKSLQAEHLANLGVIYNAMGQRPKAAESLLRAIDLYEQVGNHDTEANAVFSLGFVSLGMNDFKTAITFFARALPVAERKGDAAWVAEIESAIGMAEDESGNPEAALPMFEKAHAYYLKAHRPQELGRSYNSLGAVYRSLRRYDDATTAFTHSLEIDKQIGNALSLAIVQSNLASIYVEQGEWAKSAPLMQAAISSAETVRDQVSSPSDIGNLQQNRLGDVYVRYARVLMHLNQPGDALCAVETGRGQGLARQAVQSRSEWKGVLPAADAVRLHDATESLRSAEVQLHATDTASEKRTADDSLPAEGSDKAVDEARRLRDEAQSKLAKVRDEIAAQQPAYAALCGLDKPTMALYTRLAKEHPDTLYLSWSPTTGNDTLLFALRSDFGLKTYILPIGSAELAAHVHSWRSMILPTELGGAGKDAVAEHSDALRLYVDLFTPLVKDNLLTKEVTKRLVVIGDGALRELPFAALLDADGKRLIERFPISTGISLRLLANEAATTRPTGRGILCMADPGGSGVNDRESGIAGGFAPLPASREEGKAIATLYGAGATMLLGDAATREAILPFLSTARLLHFSTHGYLDDQEGLHSGLLIAPAASKASDDSGFQELPLLTGEDILAQPLAADLVTLSACETGQGSRGGGDGLLGLVWAFHAAGCPSVIASQWSVADASTAVLMIKFYEGLRSGMRRDEALQKAMLTLLHDGNARLAEPFFWAAFELSGESGPLGPTPSPTSAR